MLLDYMCRSIAEPISIRPIDFIETSKSRWIMFSAKNSSNLPKRFKRVSGPKIERRPSLKKWNQEKEFFVRKKSWVTLILKRTKRFEVGRSFDHRRQLVADHSLPFQKKVFSFSLSLSHSLSLALSLSLLFSLLSAEKFWTDAKQQQRRNVEKKVWNVKMTKVDSNWNGYPIRADTEIGSKPAINIHTESTKWNVWEYFWTELS